MAIPPIKPSAVAAVNLDAALPVNSAAVIASAQLSLEVSSASVVQFSPLAQ